MNAFKTFRDFEEGMTEMQEISTSIEYLFGDTPTTYEEAVASLLDTLKENPPSIFDEDFPNSRAFSIDAREFGYKFAGQLSFGCRILVSEEDDEIEYGFRITVNSQNNSLARKTSVMKKAAEKGWRLVDFQERKPFRKD